ncbi:MAG: tyrosine-protein phosphatase [Phycisphaerales bacterium]|nr:tyrosine-protein phosphatase [Phycisphaerales bacterium]
MNVPRFIRRLFRRPYDGLRHFGVVEPGVLYRSGQPTAADLEKLIREHGLRTVVSLRGARDDEDPDAWEAAERSVCANRGVEFITIPCNHKNPPTREQIERFLFLTRHQDRRPVLVHCRLGQQRTMLFVGLFRVHCQGVAPQQALAEMDERGFNSRHRRHQKLLHAFHSFSADRF